MAKDVRHPLTAALQRCDELAEILKDVSLQAILADRMSQAALEGSLHRIGSLLSSAARISSHVLIEIEDSREVIDLSEYLLTHHREIDHEALWITATATIPHLADQVREFLANLAPPQPPMAPPVRELAPFVAARREGIMKLCERFSVERLAVYGSAANGTFNPESSDVDFVVDFSNNDTNVGRRYIDLAAALEQLMERPIDLVMFHANSSEWFRNEVRRTEVVIFEQLASGRTTPSS